MVIVLVLAGGYFAYGWFKTSSAKATNCSTTTALIPSYEATAAPAAHPAVTPASGQTLDGAGSTLVAPLMFTWASSYTNNTVNYASVGSGAGISDITQK
ncbi:MAG: hypothetical protein ACHQ0I_04435, partial [Candidatus Lutacidiplasmatales archaeon]